MSGARSSLSLVRPLYHSSVTKSAGSMWSPLHIRRAHSLIAASRVFANRGPVASLPVVVDARQQRRRLLNASTAPASTSRAVLPVMASRSLSSVVTTTSASGQQQQQQRPVDSLPAAGNGKRWKIVRTDRELEMPITDAALREVSDLVLLSETVDEATLTRELQDADLLLMCYRAIPGHVIAQTRKLRAIVKYGVGIDAIDIEAAKAKGIPVVNVPEYAEETVAEAAFALMIALAKRLPAIAKEMNSVGWAWPESRWVASDLSGKTLGLIGLGRIGLSMWRMAARGFNMRVVVYDPYVDPALLAKYQIERADTLDELLPRCDFVSVHCVLNPSTRHLLGEKQLRLMKRTACLINVSRGAIVDEAALVRALDAQTIAGAGLDVYSEEPLALQGHPLSSLFHRDNVILLPHLAFYTAEAMQRLEEDTLARCREALAGEPVRVKSPDKRLRSQTKGVQFVDPTQRSV